MGLIKTDLTLEEKQDKTRIEMEAHMLNSSREQYYRMQKSQSYILNNPYGLTPQEVADAFGNRAAALFQLRAKAKDIIDAVDSSIWQLEPFPGTITPVLDDDGHPTGLVTIEINE